MFKNYELTLDIATGDARHPLIQVNTNDLDSFKISFIITQHKEPVDLTGKTIRIAILKPDRKTVLQDCTLTDAENGKGEVILDTQAYALGGKHYAEVMVYDGAEKVAVTGRFVYNANRGILNDGTVESTNEWQSINQAIADAENILIDLRENGTGVDAQARQELETVTAQLAQTGTEIDNLHLLKAGYSDIEAVANEVENIIVSTGDGSKDTEIINSRTDVTGKSASTLKERLDKSQYRDMLLTKSIEGTRQTILFNSDGSVQKVRYYNSNDEIVRADTFVYEGNEIIEKRTLHGGEMTTFIHDLDTLETVELDQEQTSDLITHELGTHVGQDGWAMGVGDSAGYMDGEWLVFDGYTSLYYKVDTFKPNTKYGVIFEVGENTLSNVLRIPTNFSGKYENIVTDKSVGHFKYIVTSSSSTKPTQLSLQTASSETGLIKVKDIRVFELPQYTQIERDFYVLTASNLNAKYPKELN